ncbi:hypothetical protein OJ997_18035 [Solirubrobacter phytolaccae]|uniref:DUF7668 domain-containing protein n=1 Tax=Solirubrobacter phytolaccae TaxID=1404360 RepID=A0A9X3SA48_9ACTN|nr:hypothetical protein [Solirubrobacter phytolaccae]MDA0182211.1 hypothetical protein [Solirubrobacter phytolaccae]
MGDHLIVMHSAVRACPGYDRHETPSMYLDGASIATETEHGRVVTAQMARRQNTLDEAIEAGILALGAAGISKGIRRQARGACEDYFYNRLELTPDYVLQPLESVQPGLEPLPEGMQKVLEDLIELVVDGDYEELRELSHERLEVEDMRRRLEDDLPEALVFPPKEIYRVEAITKSDEAEQPGWAYFLELWTDKGPAKLHIEGEIEEANGRYAASLADILP